MILEPVERRARRARGVEARRAYDDGLVGDFENALCGRAEHPGRRVEAKKIEMALEHRYRAADVRVAERVGDLGAVVAGDHLQPAGRLRRVRPGVGIPADRPPIAQQRRDRLRCFASEPVPKCSGVGVRVERHDAIASEGSERVAHEQARGRLADAALTGDERDLAAAGNRSLDPSDELALTEFGRVWWDRDRAPREQVERAAPAGGWWLSSGPEHPLGREVGGAQTRRTRRPWTDATVSL